jgi:hypothetical protein
MTTSGTSTFNLEFDDVISEAYERCGLEERDGYDMRTARRSLNLMFAEWANRGLNLWTIEQRQITMVAGQPEYTLPDDTVNVLSAVIRTNAGQETQQDITVDRISQNEYLHLPNKYTPSRPVQYYVQRTVPAKLFVYPTPPSGSPTYIFRYYGIRRIQDAGAFTNTADISFRFLPALCAGLAYHISVKKAPERTVMLKQIYDEEFTRAAQEDRDIASVYLTPSFGR